MYSPYIIPTMIINCNASKYIISNVLFRAREFLVFIVYTSTD